MMTGSYGPWIFLTDDEGMNCMGSATYYLKAKFRSHEDLKAVFPDIKQFLIEGARAEDWWQQHRSMENRGTRKEFWDQFKVEFPRIYEFLQHTGHADGDCNNDLANVMNFGSDWGIDQSFGNWYPDGVPEQNEFRYEAYVWHFADWDHLCNYLKHKFGAYDAAYVSDEYFDPYDLL